MSTPKKRKPKTEMAGKLQHRTVIPAKLWKQLSAIAEDEGIPTFKLIRQVLEQYTRDRRAEAQQNKQKT